MMSTTGVLSWAGDSAGDGQEADDDGPNDVDKGNDDSSDTTGS